MKDELLIRLLGVASSAALLFGTIFLFGVSARSDMVVYAGAMFAVQMFVPAVPLLSIDRVRAQRVWGPVLGLSVMTGLWIDSSVTGVLTSPARLGALSAVLVYAESWLVGLTHAARDDLYRSLAMSIQVVRLLFVIAVLVVSWTGVFGEVSIPWLYCLSLASGLMAAMFFWRGLVGVCQTNGGSSPTSSAWFVGSAPFVTNAASSAGAGLGALVMRFGAGSGFPDLFDVFFRLGGILNLAIVAGVRSRFYAQGKVVMPRRSFWLWLLAVSGLLLFFLQEGIGGHRALLLSSLALSAGFYYSMHNMILGVVGFHASKIWLGSISLLVCFGLLLDAGPVPTGLILLVLSIFVFYVAKRVTADH